MRGPRIIAITGSLVLALLSPLLWQSVAGASPPGLRAELRGPNGACQYFSATTYTSEATEGPSVGTVHVGSVFDHSRPPTYALNTLKPDTVYEVGVAASPPTTITEGCVTHWQRVRTDATGGFPATTTATLNLSWLVGLPHSAANTFGYTVQVVVSTSRSLRDAYVTRPFTIELSAPSWAECTACTSTADVAATAGDRSASVTFGTPYFGYLPVRYKVTATDTTNPRRGGQVAYGTASPITVRGLTAGDTYTFSVTVSNAVGRSAPSTPSTPVVPTGGR